MAESGEGGRKSNLERDESERNSCVWGWGVCRGARIIERVGVGEMEDRFFKPLE
jgi:hypothetical protein